MALKRGFTMIELLVTITIIAILIAIIIPAVKSARASSNAATCMTNLRQLGVGFMAFGAQYTGKLPGNHTQYGGSGFSNAVEATNIGNQDLYAAGGKLEINGIDPTTGAGTTSTTYHGSQPVGQGILKRPQFAYMSDWLCGMDKGYNGTNAGQAAYSAQNEQLRGGFFSQPTRGSIYPFVNTIKAYRCPTLPTVKLGFGTGYSNGQYDYTMVNYLNGARVDRVARTSTAYCPGFAAIPLATPVLLEEDPGNNLNMLSAGTDGAWCNSDITSFAHKGGTNIMTLDGSVYWFVAPKGFKIQAYYLKMPSIAPGQKSIPNGNGYGGCIFVDNTPFGWYNVN